jgi:hypothetical protein
MAGAKKVGNKFFPNAAADKICKKLKTVKGKLSLAKLSSPVDSSSGTSSLMIGAAQVSGTPPLLLAMLSGTPAPEDVLFNDNTVEAITNSTATTEQCGAFWGSNVDGESAGLSAGYTLQGVGYSYQNLTQGATSMCYMRSFPTEQNLADGAVELVSGALPSGGIANIFTPGATARKVKVSIAGDEFGAQDIYISIPSASTNAANGDAYKATLVFCNSESSEPGNIEQVRLKVSGEYTGTSLGASDEGGNFESKFTGFMRALNGRFVFDESRDRSAQVEYQSSSGNNFKSKLLLTSDGYLRNLQRDRHGGFTRKAFSVVRVEGSGLAELKVLEGAYKETGDAGTREDTAFEWRDSFYASSPQSALLDQLDLVSFENAFFDNPAEPPADLSDYSCGGSVNVELSLDMSHPNMQAVSEECEGDRVDGGDFISQSSAIQAAMNNYGAACQF